jgi:hypothetical protein
MAFWASTSVMLTNSSTPAALSDAAQRLFSSPKRLRSEL